MNGSHDHVLAWCCQRALTVLNMVAELMFWKAVYSLLCELCYRLLLGSLVVKSLAFCRSLVWYTEVRNARNSHEHLLE
jgi:hypothetical protein